MTLRDKIYATLKDGSGLQNDVDEIMGAVVDELKACPINYSPTMSTVEYSGWVNQKQAMIHHIEGGT